MSTGCLTPPPTSLITSTASTRTWRAVGESYMHIYMHTCTCTYVDVSFSLSLLSLAIDRDRCDCLPTEEDAPRCFMLSFDREAFIASSTLDSEGLREWYHDRVVWCVHFYITYLPLPVTSWSLLKFKQTKSNPSLRCTVQQGRPSASRPDDEGRRVPAGGILLPTDEARAGGV